MNAYYIQITYTEKRETAIEQFCSGQKFAKHFSSVDFRKSNPGRAIHTTHTSGYTDEPNIELIIEVVILMHSCMREECCDATMQHNRPVASFRNKIARRLQNTASAVEFDRTARGDGDKGH